VLVFLPEHYNPVHVKTVLLHGAALACAIALLLRPPRWPEELRAVGLAALALVGWSAASALWSDDPTTALAVTGDLAARALTAVGAAMLAARAGSRGVVRVVDSLLAATAIASLYGLIQRTGFDAVEYRELPSTARGTLGNPNFLAGLLVLVLPVALLRAAQLRGAARRSRPGGTRIGPAARWSLATALLLATTLVAAGSTGALLAVVALAGLVIALRGGRPGRWIGAAAIVVGLVGAGMAIALALRVAPSELEGLAAAIRSGTTETRLAIWGGSLRAAAAAPLLGAGAGAFPVAFALHRPWDYPLRAVSLNTRHAHNEALELLVELGAVGLVLGAALVLAAARVTARAAAERRGERDVVLGLALLLGVAGVLTHGVVEVITRWTVPGAMAWIVAGLGLGLVARGSAPAGRMRGVGASGRMVAALLLPLVVLALAGSARRLTIQADLNRGEQALHAGRPKAARAPLERVVARAPRDLEGLYKLAFVEQEAGNHRRALALYDRIAALSPQFSEIHLNRGVCLLGLGDHAGALRELGEHHRRSCSDMALFYAARIAATLGDLERARAHAREMRRLQRIYPAGRMPFGWKPFLRQVSPEHVAALEALIGTD